MRIEPRDYQAKALDKIYSDLQKNQNVLLQAIMGAGKTFMSVRLIQRLYNEAPDMQFLILMHKQELCLQFFEAFQKFTEIPFTQVGICCASLGEKIIDRRITIASIQTFINAMDSYRGAGLIVIDEAHRIDINSNTQYKQVIDYLRLQKPNCRILGLTATPARLGHGYIYGKHCKHGSVNLFDDVSHKISYDELKSAGHLVPLKGVVANHETLETDLAGVSTNGDYVLDQLGEIMCREIHIGTATEAINQYCAGYTRVCVFCCTIDHAVKIHEQIPDESTIVHSQLSSIERESNMQMWKSGVKRIMTSVNILTEGFDFPMLDCLVFVRPTLSSSLFLQAVGRVLRTHPGKDHGFMVDLTDNTARFGTDLDNIKVTVPKVVEEAQAKERSMWKICPACEVEVHIALRECSECGYVWQPEECQVAEKLPDMKEVVFEKQPPVWKDVVDYSIKTHKSKKSGKYLGKIDFYFDESIFKRSRVSLFLCFPDEYSGYAVQKSEEKWTMISSDDFPEDVNDFHRKIIDMPKRILIDDNGKFPELLDIETEVMEVDETFEDYEIPADEFIETTHDFEDDIPF